MDQTDLGGDHVLVGLVHHPGPLGRAVDTEFSGFFTSQYARLCWLGCALIGTPAQAEEMAQEALVRTWWRWRLVGRPKDPGSYARKVLSTGTDRCCGAPPPTHGRWPGGARRAALPAGNERAMELWQMDVMGGTWLASGQALKLATRNTPSGRWTRIVTRALGDPPGLWSGVPPLLD